ncbi:hypothetical protein Ahy_B01g056774 [Arachis hypogaea]|uniref:Uncharacterized protein n=1 Tax=Arachis hypogaea TaxID=3818 RepID=A0A445AZI8_ARAHY|nr:hypothetical protein Ahy_B01g056774 [Arachis hypogaea]
MMQKELLNSKDKGATPSIHSRIFFSSDGETVPKGIPSPAKFEKGNAVVVAPVDDKEKGVDLDKEYFDEGDDKMVSTISIIPTEYLREYKGKPNEYYDVKDEEAFAFIFSEDKLEYFQTPTEKQKSHLRPLHVSAYMSGICVNKILVDGEATISLLPERMLIKVGKHFDDLIPTNILVTDYSSILTPAKGLATLRV